MSSVSERYLDSEHMWARHASSSGGSQYVGASSCGIAGEAPIVEVRLYLGLGGLVKTPICCGFWAQGLCANLVELRGAQDESRNVKCCFKAEGEVPRVGADVEYNASGLPRTSTCKQFPSVACLACLDDFHLGGNGPPARPRNQAHPRRAPSGKSAPKDDLLRLGDMKTTRRSGQLAVSHDQRMPQLDKSKRAERQNPLWLQPAPYARWVSGVREKASTIPQQFLVCSTDSPSVHD
ncbi:hypothetical protein GY45DRAFT_1392682 [Cubamyces sp. BRFM 1775]|nr:hypothetical protein GY45DRAFT_1392682 [Cubamyces sp. BRFM 1775]